MRNKKIIKSILLIFFICSIVEYVEFLFIRTDMTFLADNILTKIFIVIIIFVSLRIFKLKLSDIGFKFKGVSKGIFYGLSLGTITFTTSYLIEILILHIKGFDPSIKFFITNFGLTGSSNSLDASLIAVIICIIVNIINVIAEEGLFRGLFLKLGEKNILLKPQIISRHCCLGYGIW